MAKKVQHFLQKLLFSTQADFPLIVFNEFWKSQNSNPKNVFNFHAIKASGQRSE